MSFMAMLLLWILLAAFVISNIIALVGGKPNADPTRPRRLWLQRSTSGQLAVMAWLFWALGMRATPLALYALLIALGMTLAFAADLIMAEIIRLPDPLLGGILVFAVVHLCYSAAYLSAEQVLGILNLPLLAICLGSMLILSVGIWRRWVWAPAATRVLNGAALGYALLIGAMAAIALTLAIGERRLWLLAPGALLFMTSDIILGNQRFRRHHWRYGSEVVWLTYIIGQACIVWSNAAWRAWGG